MANFKLFSKNKLDIKHYFQNKLKNNAKFKLY